MPSSSRHEHSGVLLESQEYLSGTLDSEIVDGFIFVSTPLIARLRLDTSVHTYHCKFQCFHDSIQ